VSRVPLRRAEKDLYSRHSERIARALQLGELDYHGYAILSFLVDVIDLPGRSGEAIFTLEGLSDGLKWPLGPERLRQKLHELRRDGWIDFDEPRRGPAASWVFRLAGAALDADRDDPRIDFQTEASSDLETNSNLRLTGEATNPYADRDSGLREFPNADAPRAEQRAEAVSIGNYDYVLGKTTAAALEAAEEVNFLHAVGAAAAEALEREREFLADCEALVGAGLARWREAGEL
jgi:hypothetical protein